MIKTFIYRPFIFFYLILFSIFFYSKNIYSQKKNSTTTFTEVPPPDWVSQRPVSSSKYIGIGVASKIGNPNYQFEAKKNALYDLTSEIKVNISSNSMLYSVQNDNQFSQSFNSYINLKSVEDIEGYQLIGTYENDKQYWVYYQLDKQEYLDRKNQKKKNTISKAAQIIQLAINDDNQKNYTSSLRKKIQAFSILVPYLNEEIDFSTYHIPNINNIFDLIKDIQFKLQAIVPVMPKNIPVVKPYQTQYTPVQLKLTMYGAPLSQFPFQFFYDDDVLQTSDRAVTSADGILEVTPLYVRPSFQMTNVEFQPDLEALTKYDSISPTNIRFLKSFIQIPKYTLSWSVQPINVFIQTKELNLNKPINDGIIKNLFFNKLKSNEINIVNDSLQADYIIKIKSNTYEDDNSEELKNKFNVVLAQMIIDIYMYDKNKNLIYNQILNNIYGYGANIQLASNNAYMGNRITNVLNEALFYVKRKMISY